jgi:type VI secretion system protein ImpL
VNQLLGYLPLPRRWAATLAGALALSTLLWFLGPTLGFGTFRPLESVNVRLAVVLVLVIAWVGMTWFAHAREAAANKKMIAAASGGEAPSGDPASAQIRILRQRLEEAQRHLKRLRGADRRGKKYLYELPWYILIGPPGAGKTTALVNCGLKFPLADRHGSPSVRGAAGTRNCDWFLTDEAVLVDTAGRYTTQDSDQNEDQAAWLGFLDLLKENRPRQPINGVLIAISLSDLITLPQVEQAAHARAIRARLGELLDRFGVRFPVYVLFTKADLIAGFTETFEPLTREGREQVWGATLPLDAGGDAEPAVLGFGAEFRLLLDRLDEKMIDRVQEEADPRRRGLIFGLPTQLASLREAMREFLEEIFLASRYDTRPLLRGVYFTSGTQEGTPIDRLMGAIAQRFGLQASNLTAFSGSGRSYFLSRLLREVIFGEASLVSTNQRVERRRKLLRWGFYGATALVFIAACGAWANSYFLNREAEAAVSAAADAAMAETSSLNTAVLKDDDPSRVLAALDKLRQLPGGYQANEAVVPVSMTFGLYQGARLHSEAVAAYQRGLNLLLLPRLLSRLQQQLAANLTKPEFLYDGLRIYLMLGGRHPVDRKIVREWMTLDWQSLLPGPEHAAARTALLNHLDVLLDARLEEYPLDANVVEEARRTLRQFPVAGRAYLMLKDRVMAAQPPDWSVVDHAGPAADRVLVRLSGKLLSDGLSGFYTRAVFYRDVLPRLADLVQAVEDDTWILTDAGDAKGANPTATLTSDVLALYYDDYIKHWEGLLGDILLQSPRNLGALADTLNFAAGPTSPLKMVWQAIDRETQLAHPPIEAAAGTPPSPSGTEKRIASALGAAGNTQPIYGQPVEEKFRRFHDTVASLGGGPAIIDLLLQDLAELSKDASRIAAATSGADSAGVVSDAAEVVHKLANWHDRLPPQIADVPRSVARNAMALIKGETHGDLDRQWNAKVLQFCNRALDGRYPLQKSAAADVTLDDFSRLFAPNGLIDGFFNSSLRPFVDTTQDPWKLRNPADVNVSPEALAQFQRASLIRDMFFGAGTTPVLRFEITPLSIDASSSRAVLSIDGQEVVYEGNSGRTISVQWPGPGGVRESTLGFALKPADTQPTATTQAATTQAAQTQAAQIQAAQIPAPIQAAATQPTSPSIRKTGPWSLFRLLDAGRLEKLGGPDRWRVTFSTGVHSAVYEVHAGSVVNPLTSNELAKFKCPSAL